MVVGAEGGVGPDAVVALAVSSYVAPGARPARVQSYGTEHVTAMGCPPPIGVAVSVKGPVTPDDDGEMSTLTDPGPVTATSSAGAPAAGVVMVAAGDGGVGRPEVASVPVNATV